MRNDHKSAADLRFNSLVSRIWLRLGTVLLVLGSAAGCMESSDSRESSETGDEQTGEQSSDLGLFNQPYIDISSQCNATDLWLHCCPQGYAMVGVRLDQNWFKCQQILYPTGNRVVNLGSTRFVSGPAIRACPYGSVMVGFQDGSPAVLLCQFVTTPSVAGEYVDTATRDGNGIHVCQTTAFAMSGIDVAGGRILCAD